MLVSDAVPMDTINIFYPIVNLPAGDYLVLFQIGDEELSLPLTLLDNNIFDSVSVVPNITSTGFAEIHYCLKSIPSRALRISVIDLFGIELLEVINSVPSSLSNQLPLNLSSYLSGYYFVVFEVEDIFYITPPFILSIIKQ